jgi:hypothetical protein
LKFHNLWDNFAGMQEKDGLAQLKRENRAVELRHGHGLTFASIARELGYETIAGAQKAYKRGLKRIEHPDAGDYLQADLDRLDNMTEVFWQSAVQGNLRSAQMILQIMQKRADYLGLDAPKKVQAEVVNYEGTGSIDAEVIQLARIIDYIEGVAADITTLPEQQDTSQPNNLAKTRKKRTTTA